MPSEREKTSFTPHKMQFGLKSLFLLVLAVSCAMGWISYEQKRKLMISRARTEISEAGGHCYRNCSLSKGYRVSFRGSQLTDEQLDRVSIHLKNIPLIYVEVSECLVTQSAAARLDVALSCRVVHPSLNP